ncbi:MAG: oligopeptide:H+ symporter, partial [Myxococcales bacterium]|nr:oligopeptide:H+ symporter [Myxococcales bacterium]
MLPTATVTTRIADRARPASGLARPSPPWDDGALVNPPIEHDPHEDTLFGHPKGLFVLFAAEMWERFCYYGMRALLTLYLTKALLMGDAVASGIYGAYTALVYAAPVLGGRIADRLLGYRKAIIFGGILMAIGEFVLLGATEMTLYAGMGLIIVGNGYFKANISTVVGRLYRDGDERRDSGFTIFYLGINLGALLATTVCAWVGETYGYHYGFGLAGVGMLIGIGAFIFGLPLLQGHGLPPDETYLHEKVFGVSRQNLTYLASIAAAPLLYFVLQQHHFVEYLHTLDIPAINAVIAFMDPLDYALWGIWLLVNGKLIQNALRENDGGVLLHRTYALIILQVFNIVFWACFEQAGTSLTLFADRNVDRAIGSWVMPASMTQSANSFFIVAFAGFFSALWLKLDRLNINPNIPMKFGLGII